MEWKVPMETLNRIINVKCVEKTFWFLIEPFNEQFFLVLRTFKDVKESKRISTVKHH